MIWSSLAPVLTNGGAEAAAEAGHLRTPETVALLTKIGSREALELLSLVESNDPAVHELLCEFVTGLELPPAETAVMTHYRHDDIPLPGRKEDVSTPASFTIWAASRRAFLNGVMLETCEPI